MVLVCLLAVAETARGTTAGDARGRWLVALFALDDEAATRGPEGRALVDAAATRAAGRRRGMPIP